MIENKYTLNFIGSNLNNSCEYYIISFWKCPSINNGKAIILFSISIIGMWTLLFVIITIKLIMFLFEQKEVIYLQIVARKTLCQLMEFPNGQKKDRKVYFYFWYSYIYPYFWWNPDIYWIVIGAILLQTNVDCKFWNI